VVRRGAGFDTDQTGRQLLEERQDVAALQLAANEHLAASVDAVNLENRLGDVETAIVVIVCMVRSSESWEPNSAHIHGTDVPVEEPSTSINNRHQSRLARQSIYRKCACKREIACQWCKTSQAGSDAG